MTPLFLAFSLAVAPGAQAFVDQAESLRRAGRLDEAQRALDGGAPALAKAASETDRLRLRFARARITYYRGTLTGASHDAVIAELREIVAAAAPLADAALLADARDHLGLAVYLRDFGATDQVEPRSLFEQALAARRAGNDGRAVAESLFHVALTWENKKDPTKEDLARARALHAQALAVAEAGGFDVEASYPVRHLAGHRQDAGDLDGALAGFERSLSLREKAGYAIYLAPSLMAVGDVWKAKGDAAKARGYYERAGAEADRIGAARFRTMADEALSALPGPARR
jgi:tetratricopeptide (TPR) repeat protein